MIRFELIEQVAIAKFEPLFNSTLPDYLDRVSFIIEISLLLRHEMRPVLSHSQHCMGDQI